MMLNFIEVFKKEYREDTAYMELMSKHVNSFRLDDDSEDVDEKIQRLEQYYDPLIK